MLGHLTRNARRDLPKMIDIEVDGPFGKQKRTVPNPMAWPPQTYIPHMKAERRQQRFLRRKKLQRATNVGGA